MTAKAVPALGDWFATAADPERAKTLFWLWCLHRQYGRPRARDLSFGATMHSFRRFLLDEVRAAGGTAADFLALEDVLNGTFYRLDAAAQKWATVRCVDCGAAWSEHVEWVKRCPACGSFDLTAFDQAPPTVQPPVS